MKMNLKNRNLKKIKITKKSLTSKNLFIFLLSLSLITILIGIIFFFLLSESDKETSINSITNYFAIKESYNYLKLLKDSILEMTFNSFLIWVLGISVIGVLGVIFIYFFEMFSIGFTISSIFVKYNSKGIVATISYLFPSRICYLVLLFLLTFFSIRMSYKIIKLCFSKKEINIKAEMNKYIKLLIISFFSIIVISILKVFIDPLLIKIFISI